MQAHAAALIAHLELLMGRAVSCSAAKGQALALLHPRAHIRTHHGELQRMYTVVLTNPIQSNAKLQLQDTIIIASMQIAAH